MNKILLMYHCEANTGYAIAPLEEVFWEMALKLTGSPENIFISYRNYSKGYPNYPPPGYLNYVEFNERENSVTKAHELAALIKSQGINILFGFDQPLSLPYYRLVRAAGISTFISYWGAPMSSLNKGVKLLLKKIEARTQRLGPDLYIFESKAMQETATLGRGIPPRKTAVCHLGIDTNKYKPDSAEQNYAHQLFNTPPEHKILFYSGHFEERKGIRVICQAANLVCARLENVSFILCGNKDGEEAPYFDMLDEVAKTRVHFGGYRHDLHRIHRSCYAGIIASTGWDSFTMSALEIQASGLPLLVSNLQGLRETIAEGETGISFLPGSSEHLAEIICMLVASEKCHSEMSLSARRRVVSLFSRQRQVDHLQEAISNLITSDQCEI